MPSLISWDALRTPLQIFTEGVLQAKEVIQQDQDNPNKTWVDTARSIGNVIQMLLLESLSLTLCVILYPSVLLPLTSTPPGSSQRYRPILLVHGYAHNHSGWLFIRHRLQRSGFGPIHTLNLGSPLKNIESYAECLQDKVEDIKKETDGTAPVLIGHSMGGVVCSYYNEYLASSEDASHVITIGSPLGGTHVAKIGPGICCDQMKWDSSFIQDLTQRIQANRHGVYYHHIASKVDQFIIPQHSAIMGKHPDRELILEDHGHLGLLFSKQVSRQVRKWIQALPPF